MITTSLDVLTSDEFVSSTGSITSAAGLRRFLYKSQVVQDLRRAIGSGIITESAIRRFVERLSNDFEKGKQFPHELAFAALAVALEERRTDFVEEFLLNLARLKIIEITVCPLIARESLMRWYKLPRIKAKEVEFRGRRKTRRLAVVTQSSTWINRTYVVPNHNKCRPTTFETCEN